MKKLLTMMLILLGTSNLIAEQGPSGPAYVVTWQNSTGYWFAVGTAQVLWTGEPTEEKALNYVRGSNSKVNDELKKIKTCGKFSIYSLGVNYGSEDVDAIKYTREKGLD